MAGCANNDMVVHGDAEPAPGLDDVAGDGDVLLGRARVAARMIVDEEEHK